MTEDKKVDPVDAEISAMGAIYKAVKDLDASAQERVLAWVSGKIGVALPKHLPSTRSDHSEHGRIGEDEVGEVARVAAGVEASDDGELDGISPVARKWMARNGLGATDLSLLFSLGIDDIDLVAKSVPGDTTKARMRSVFLLRAVGAYLSSGAARVTHDQVKEACLHYDAYDRKNFSAYVKSLSAEVSGNADNGYQLTARGLTNATEMIKQLVKPKPSK